MQLQTTFHYFLQSKSDKTILHTGCTILPQAYTLTLIFTLTGLVDFREPRCIHCWSRKVRKNGTITKRVLYSLDDDHRFKCQHYKCLTCGRPSSPILGNAFVYDASAEGIKRLNKVTDALEKWESEQLNEQDLAGHIYQAVKEIYSENIIFPRGKNVIYNEPELVDIMIRNIIDCQCSEMSSNLLNLPGRGKKVPDADTLLIYLGRNSEGDVRKNLEHLFDTVNQKAKDIGLYNNPVPVAIDFHLEPYYGKQRKKRKQLAILD